MTFPRSYDHQDQTVFTPTSLLPALVAKPGAWANSPVRPLMPDSVRGVLDDAAPTDRARLLDGINQASAATSFPSAVIACAQLIAVGQDPAGPGLGMLARRIAGGAEPADASVDLSVYDLVAHSTRTQKAQVGA